MALLPPGILVYFRRGFPAPKAEHYWEFNCQTPSPVREIPNFFEISHRREIYRCYLKLRKSLSEGNEGHLPSTAEIFRTFGPIVKGENNFVTL